MKRIMTWGMLLSLLLSGLAFADSAGDKTRDLLAGLESAKRAQRVDAAKIIARSGLTDAELYRKIAEIIEANYRKGIDLDLTDEIAWMCKALAASGDAQYKPLLGRVAAESPSVKLQHYAKQSLELFERYAQRRDILNARENWDATLSDEENQLLGMLGSSDIPLRRDAAKIVTRRKQTDAKVFDAVAAALSEMLANFKQNDLVYADTMAWLCKALATSGDTKYVALLETARDATPSIKVKSYAEKALKALR